MLCFFDWQPAMNAHALHDNWKWVKPMEYTLTIDPEFKRLLPALRPEEFRLLEESILAEGCRDPIVVWENIIVDGHNRYEICQKNHLEFKTE